MIIGINGADDAAVIRLSDNRLLLQTVDFFTPVVDDPYQFGQIAAANSLSDIYAMGGTPLFALNIVGFPIKELSKDILIAILQGGIDKAREAGIAIVGGHSIDDREPKYGLVVTGEVDADKILTNSGARPGDVLLLTKPLGTGIITTAIKQGNVDPDTIQATVNSMSELNRLAAEAAHQVKAHAVTDITGFGLLGHLGEMCLASNVSAQIAYSTLPFLPQVDELVKAGTVPGGTKRNLAYAEKFTRFDPGLTPDQRLLSADAQTSGGLLVSMAPEKADEFQDLITKSTGFLPALIGEIDAVDADRITIRK